MRHMINQYIKVILPVFLLIVVVFEQSGVKVNTNIQSTGNTNVTTSTQVQSTGSESTSYKKVEVDVNGVKKVYESTDPGSESIEVSGDENGVEVKVNKQPSEKSDSNEPEPTKTTKVKLENSINAKEDELPYSFTYESIHDYIVNTVKDFFKSLFS